MNNFHQEQNSYPDGAPNPPYGGSSYSSTGETNSNPPSPGSGWGAPPPPPPTYGVPVGNPYVPGEQPGSAVSGYQQHTSSGFRPPEHQPEHQYSASNGWQQTPSPDDGNKPKKPKKPHRVRKVLLSVTACVLGVAVLGFAGIGIYSVANGAAVNQDNGVPPSSSEASASDGQIPAGGNATPGMTMQDVPRVATASPDGKLSTEEIVEKVSPSVVAVLIYDNFSSGPVGMGSGIIIREDGYIVTNSHVVDGSSGLVVQRNNGETLEARVVGVDKQTDLAVIKVEASGLPYAVFGNSSQVKVGEKVIAIGNPQSMSFYGTVTQGIVSGLNRQIQAVDNRGSVTNYTDLIQTDATINQGNSGGALVNEYGQVIGINVAKAGGNGVEGIGFAIPSNDAAEVVDDLIQYKRVMGRVLLGIKTTGAVNEVEARRANIPVGVRVSSTEEGSDISKKGVLPGDIITKIDEQEIKSISDIQLALKGKKAGDSVKLEVYRPPMQNSAVNSKRTGFYEVTVQVMEDTGTDTQEEAPQTQPQQPSSPYDSQDGGEEYIDPFDYFFRQFYN